MLDFESAVETARRRVERGLGRLLIAPFAGGALVTAATLPGLEPGGRTFMIASIVVCTLTVWLTATDRRGRMLTALNEACAAPIELWFHSPNAGLVFFSSEGVFAERRGFFPWEPANDPRLVSVSYDEHRHALELQTRETWRGRDVFRRLRLAIDRGVSAAVVTRAAVAANVQLSRKQ